MKIIWSPLAVDRVAETASYISQDSSAEAVKWVTKIFNSVNRLEAFPESGRIVPEINNHAIREIIIATFAGSYYGFYQGTNEEHIQG